MAGRGRGWCGAGEEGAPPDFRSFVKWFLRPDQEIVGIKYFTAPIKTYPHDGDAVDHQKVYLQALSSMPLITMPPIFNRRKTSMFDNIDSRPRIEREIGKRIEAAKCSRWEIA